MVNIKLVPAKTIFSAYSNFCDVAIHKYAIWFGFTFLIRTERNYMDDVGM